MFRPKWEGARSIGTFERLIEVQSYLSIITNCALIAFTSSSWESITTSFVLFILLEVRTSHFYFSFLKSDVTPLLVERGLCD